MTVLIVGGGPVGLGLAVELGQRRVRCTVVERRAEPQRIPKGQNLTQRTLEHFHFWGAEHDLRAARTIPTSHGIGGLTAYGTLLGAYSYDWLQRDLVGQFYFTANERLPQYETEAVLRRRAARIPGIDLRFGWTAQRIAQDADGVTLEIQARDGGAREVLRGPFLVGCDGSHSMVRTSAGIGQMLDSHDRQMVLLVFRSGHLHEMLAERYPGKSYFIVLHPEQQGYWKFLGRVDLEGLWFFHGPVPTGTSRDSFDFRSYVAAAVGASCPMDVEYVGFWDLRFAVADTYRSGRVFIAGDAAHSHPPYGGYGINTGLEDAVNLGWKLAAHLAGWAGPGLLDSYSEERRAVFVSTSENFIERAVHRDRDFLAAFSPERDRTAFEQAWARRREEARMEIDQFEPHYEGASIVWGGPSESCGALGAHMFRARAGHHLAPVRLSSGRDVYEELGADFTLLAFDADPAGVRAIADAAARLRLPLHVITDDCADGRDRYEARLILVRPDQFVAWVSTAAPDDPHELLRRAIGAALRG